MQTSFSIVTWNINSIRIRTQLVVDFLRAHAPDVLCLQEIKCVDADFPSEVFAAEGYSSTIFGMKAYNGVAVLTKNTAEIAHKNVPNFPDELARYIEITVPFGDKIIRIGNLYAPNGNPITTEKYPYKINWLNALHAHAHTTLAFEEPFILLGDYNIIPHEIDTKNPSEWVNDALFQPESRAAYQKLLNLGLLDAFRACNNEAGHYTFWDYQAGAWPKNNGIRIDHALLSPQAADMLHTVIIHKNERDKEKPSDHVPVEVRLTF